MISSTQKEYNDLLRSGMFFEWYPNLSGDWEKDAEQWFEIYYEMTKLRGK